MSVFHQIAVIATEAEAVPHRMIVLLLEGPCGRDRHTMTGVVEEATGGGAMHVEDPISIWVAFSRLCSHFWVLFPFLDALPIFGCCDSSSMPGAGGYQMLSPDVRLDVRLRCSGILGKFAPADISKALYNVGAMLGMLSRDWTGTRGLSGTNHSNVPEAIGSQMTLHGGVS